MDALGNVTIGAVFVLIAAAGRFNTPPSNRSSTTALRYWVAFSGYLAIGLGLYAVLLSSGSLLEGVRVESGFFGELAKNFSSTSLVAALMLTILLPKIPLLAECDAWIRERLQRMAAIPYEARRLADELDKSRFAVSQRLQEVLRAKLVDEGFQAEDLLFEESPGIKHRWTKLSTLMIQIEGWKTDRRFIGFIDQFQADFNGLSGRYRRLRPRVAKLFRLLREMPAGGGRTDELVLQVQTDLTEQTTELLDDIYNFISRGLLHCEVMYSARAASLAMLGFDLRTIKLKQKLTLNHMMTLFGLVAILVLAGMISLSRASGVSVEELFARVVMIATIYSVAVVCAVYPKERWAFARREPCSIRPVAFYFVVGVLAAVASVTISFLFNILIFRNLTRTWLHLLLTYPWSLCAFVTAFAVAWMTDDRATSFLSRDRLRWVEGLAAASALALSVLIVFPWLDQVAAHHHASRAHSSPLFMALTMSGAIGFTIGFLIPTWYREAPREDIVVEDVELANRFQPAGVGV